jgi:hypothetical protein
MAWATHGRAQQDVRERRIGLLSGVADTDPEIQSWVKEFVQGLEKLGWVNGRNVRIDTRFGDADAAAARLSTLAAELIELGPDVILAVGAPAAAAVRQQTLSLPIVLRALLIRSPRDSLRTCPGQRGISRASPISSFRSEENGCSFLRNVRQVLTELRCYFNQPMQYGLHICGRSRRRPHRSALG